MTYSWIVTLPPLIVIILGITTHNITLSLAMGIATACLIATAGNMLLAVKLMGTKLLHATSLVDLVYQTGSYDHAYVFGFLVALGILITLMQTSGGIAAYARFVRSFISNPRQAATMSLTLSPILCFDDYLNTLVNGSIMRPIFEKFSVAKEKLAYLLNAISSSQCLLIPISSWLAVILTELHASGVGHNGVTPPLVAMDPFTLYTRVIPYLLYPILSIASAWFIIRCNVSYGAMHTAEERAKHAHTAITHDASEPHASALAFILPLGTLLLALPVAMTICGGWRPGNPTMTILQAMQNADAILPALWWASAVACMITVIAFFAGRFMSLAQIGNAALEGALSMKGSMIMLTLAWTLSSLLRNEVQTGNYLANLLIAGAPLSIIPAACFITATLITASIGSSWAMIGIMVPLVIPLVTSLASASNGSLESIPLLLPTLGALFSGAAAGPQISPIADAAIISSTVAGTTPIAHIRTLLPYAIPPFLSALCGFLVLAWLRPSFVVISCTIIATIVLMVLLHGLQILNHRRKHR